METYEPSHSLFSTKADFSSFKEDSLQLKKELFDRTMPLHQIILFANQAAIKKDIVCITVEKKINERNFLRFTMKGIFRKKVNHNRQIIFESSDKKTLHLLPIESILSIQLTS